MSRRTKCPICGKPPVKEFAPFCSRGCRDRDFLRWMGEDYRLPAEPAGPGAEPNADYGVDSTGSPD